MSALMDRKLSVMIARVLLKAHGGDSIDPAARTGVATPKVPRKKNRWEKDKTRKANRKVGKMEDIRFDNGDRPGFCTVQ